ncbi:MAG: DUF748 domain-containing protein [Thiohalobacteraceae bacterium]
MPIHAQWDRVRSGTSRLLRRKAVRIGLALLVVYALIGFLLIPYAIEQYLPKYARETLQRQASVAAVRVNPFLFRVEADNFRLRESDGRSIVAFRHLLVDFGLSGLFRWAWTFDALHIDGLDLFIDKDPDGTLNLTALAESFPKDETPQPEDDRIVRVLLKHFALIDGVVAYSDRSGTEPAIFALQPLNLELSNFATLRERTGAYELSAELPDGGNLHYRGETTLRPFVVAGEISIQGLRPSAFWEFLQDKVRLAEPEGTIVFQTSYRYALEGEEPQLHLQRTHLHIADLDLREPGAQTPLLALRSLEIRDAAFDLNQRTITLPQLALRNGRVGAALAEDGTVNWQRLVAPSGEPVRTADAAVEEPAAPWRIQLGAGQVEDVAVQVNDRSRATPLAYEVGQLGAQLGADVQIGTDATDVRVNGIALRLGGLALVPIGEDEPLATLGAFELDGGNVDTAAREIGIDRVALREGRTHIERDAQGDTRLFAAFTGAETGDAEAVQADAPEGQSPWRYKLNTLQLDDYGLTFRDQSLQPAVAYDLEGITAALNNLSNDAQTPVEFAAALGVTQGGALQADGSFVPDGSNAKARVQLENLALAPLAPLLAQHAALVLKTGAASAAAELDYAGGDQGTLRANGTASVADLLINESVSGDRFIAWKKLAAEGIAYQSSPQSNTGKLTIDAMRLSAPHAKVQIFEDRSVNLIEVFEQGAAKEASAKPAPDKSRNGESQFPVSIGRLRVDNGTVDYSDQSLVLPFSAKIREFQGTVTGISSAPNSRAKVDLEGRVEDYGSAQVTGSLAPFAPKRFTDIRTQFSNIDMPPFSPYSATFAGRKIASGKLSLDLEYKINEGELSGDNDILLERFTLGESVESPDALDLPLDLAVALLTDSRGRIDIAVPVSGDMDNPEFSLGGVIGQAIRRMLTRIVTAPFAALGSLFGGGEQANAVAFEPGSERLSPPQQEKLANVGKALNERPQLKVIVGGRYDTAQDGAALRSLRVRRELAAALDVKLAPDEDPGRVAYDEARTQRALQKLLEARAGNGAVEAFQADYEKRTGQPVKRVNPMLALLGQASPDHAFYEALFEHLVEIHPLDESDLQALAQRRAEAVAESLVTDAGVEQQRVELGQVEAAEGASGAEEGMVETQLSLDVQKTGN